METNKNENMTVQDLWDEAKVVIRGKYIAYIGLPQEAKKKVSNTKLNLKPEGARKGTANKA